MTKNTEANKRIVERFVEEVPVRGNLDALDELVAEDYVQHNPQAGQGRTGVREFFANLEQLLGDELDPTGDLQVNLIAEGDFVVRQAIRENGMLVDIWRVSGGVLVEHWDAWRPAEGHDRLPGF